MAHPRPPIFFADDFAQRINVGWRVEPGAPDPANPLIEPEHPWDDGCPFSHGTVLIDPTDGKWKMWYISTPHADVDNSFDRRLTYAESDDGVNWVRPMLDLAPFDESLARTNHEYVSGKRPQPTGPIHPRTNILLDHASGGSCAFASVFINESAPPDERFEMYLFREPSMDGPQTNGIPHVQGLPPVTKEDSNWLCRYTSADGLRWAPRDGPISLDTNDTCWVYKELGHRYVIHHKLELTGELPTGFTAQLPPYEIACCSPKHNNHCRVQWRRTSNDGIHWSDKQLVLAPDPMDPPDTQFHELTVFPYSEQGFVDMVATEHCNEQTLIPIPRTPDRFWPAAC